MFIDWLSENVATVLTVLKVAVGLGVVIIFHELGHFIFAKKIGARVDVFSIGFGPKIFGFKKGETEYRLSLVPLGGYVKIFGQGGLGDEEEKKDPRFFENKSPGQRFWVFVAGVTMNFLMAFPLCFLVFLMGRQVPGNVVTNIEPGSPAFEAGIKEGDTIVSIMPSSATSADGLSEEDWTKGRVENWAPVNKALILRDKDESLWLEVRHEGQEETSKFRIPPKVLNASDLTQRLAKIGMSANDTVMFVANVLDDSPAAGKLEKGDVFVSINGKEITDQYALANLLNESLEPQDVYIRLGVESAPRPVAGPISLVIKRKDNDGQYREVSFHDYVPKVQAYYDLGLVLQNKPVVGSIRNGSPAYKAGLKPGDTITRFGGATNVRCWQDIEDAFSSIQNSGEAIPVEGYGPKGPDSPDSRFSYELTPQTGGGVAEALGMVFQKGLYIRKILPGSPMSEEVGGLSSYYERPAPGDLLLQIDNLTLGDSYTTPSRFKYLMSASYPASKEGRPERMLVTYQKPDGTKKTVGIGNPLLSYRALLGIQTAAMFREGSRVMVRYNVGEAALMGLEEPFVILGLTYFSISKMISGEVGTKELRGPIGIFQIAYKTAEDGLPDLIYILAFISINLAILNILPIPVLDGGHILFLIIEKIRGRPLSEKTRARLDMVGLALILGLVVFAVWNDISR